VEHASDVLTPWTNFYVMTGSASAALTGLMFVVITLVMGRQVSALGRQRSRDGLTTFSTPTVVHFGSALLVAAVLVAPWHVLVHTALILGVAGLGGVAYVSRILHRTTKLTAYNPDLEDWMWYTVAPLLAYTAILAGAILLVWMPVDALFAFAIGVLLLIFIGIRNAWDIVTFIAVGGNDEVAPPAERVGESET
jgi:hypothetical protein